MLEVHETLSKVAGSRWRRRDSSKGFPVAFILSVTRGVITFVAFRPYPVNPRRDQLPWAFETHNRMRIIAASPDEDALSAKRDERYVAFSTGQGLKFTT